MSYSHPSSLGHIPTWWECDWCEFSGMMMMMMMMKTTMRMGIVDMIMMMMIGGSLGGAVAVAEADKVTPPCRGRHTNTHYSGQDATRTHYSGQDATLLKKDATLCIVHGHIKIV